MYHPPAKQFAPPRPDRPDEPLTETVAGKASRFLARHARTQMLALGNAMPMISFTFDDVPASACKRGADLLERYKARGTFYVAGGGCGAMSPGGRLATRDQLNALHVRGHELGCHTYSHPAISELAHDELVAELERNRSFLHGISSAIAVRNFAYPYGDLSFRTKRYLATRFDSCRSLLHGVNEGTVDLGALKTFPLENASMGRADICDFIARTVQVNGWLIFASHDVAAAPSRFGVTPDLLEFALSTAQAAGCRLVTVAEGFALARGGKKPMDHAA